MFVESLSEFVLWEGVSTSFITIKVMTLSPETSWNSAHPLRVCVEDAGEVCCGNCSPVTWAKKNSLFSFLASIWGTFTSCLSARLNCYCHLCVLSVCVCMHVRMCVSPEQIKLSAVFALIHNHSHSWQFHALYADQKSLCLNHIFICIRQSGRLHLDLVI